MTISLEEALESVPQWVDADDLKTTLLSSSLTHDNYRVELDGEVSVLRLGTDNDDRLGINRRAEVAAHQVAAAAGIAPKVVFVIKPENYLVTRFLPGHPPSPQEMGQPEMIERVVNLLKQVHALPEVPYTFSPFRAIETYIQTARSERVSFPLNFAWLQTQAERIEAAFSRQPLPPALCHNNLARTNLLDDGQLHLLDWAFAGMGDPYFDLANLAVQQTFSLEQEQLLLKPYVINPATEQFARLQLMKLVAIFYQAMQQLVYIGLDLLSFDDLEVAFDGFNHLAQSFKAASYDHWLAQLIQDSS